MSINNKEFGIFLRNIRKNMHLTQNDVSELVHFDVSTLRNYEKGNTIPSIEYLDLLSCVYNIDLVEKYFSYRLPYPDQFTEILEIIEDVIQDKRFEELVFYIKYLQEAIEEINSNYLKNKINQYILFLEGLFLVDQKKYEDSNILFKKAINVTNPEFSFDNYESYFFSSQELRILTYMAINFKKISDFLSFEKYISFAHCISDKNFPIYEKLSYYMASIYIYKEEYEEALHYVIEALISAEKNNNFKNLYYIYYYKGICEYYLNIHSYIESFTLSIATAMVLKKHEFIDYAVNHIKKLGIDHFIELKF